MFVAVTGEDQHNLVACQIAKTKFKVPRTIAPIKNPKNEGLFKKLGIDVTICSTNVILEHITEEVPTHPLTHLMEIPEGGLEVVEVRIPAGSASAGKSVKDLLLPAGRYAVIDYPERPEARLCPWRRWCCWQGTR